jgi:hypothetical protein
MELLIRKIKEFEKKFNDRKILDIDLEIVNITEDLYIANLIIIFENGDIESIIESEYPRKFIDLFKI